MAARPACAKGSGTAKHAAIRDVNMQSRERSDAVAQALRRSRANTPMQSRKQSDAIARMPAALEQAQKHGPNPVFTTLTGR